MEQQNYIPPQRQFKSLTIGDWLITFLIQAIPVVGFIMLFVWAFGGDTHPSKKTWAQATLIFMVIIVVLTIIVFALIGGLIMSMFQGMDYDYST
jgi:heme/copper-type cytochrome/quinol oxidase subunit 2